jgi:anthranilate synthase component II
MTVVVVDARDSFVHIVAEYFEREGVSTRVVRPDLEDVDEAIADTLPEALVLGPGPGHPAESCHPPLVREYLGRLPILGVCLGHQALGLHFGWAVRRGSQPCHGKRTPITHTATGLFDGIPSPMYVARYHSLVVSPTSPSNGTEITAWTDDDHAVMALENRALRAWGVQFHPESYGTSDGQRLIGNFCALAGLTADRATRLPRLRQEAFL